MVPNIIKMLDNDIRWHILTLLVKSDYRVQELADLTDTEMNKLSYHLGLLRENGFVNERRSSADGRDVYYSINLDALRADYTLAAELIHPALLEQPAQDTPQPRPLKLAGRPRILVLCTHNSARSQMAEGIFRHLGKGQLEVFSAGTEPSRVNPDAIRAMAERGIDISTHTSDHVNQYIDQRFDYVVTVCDSARETCPVFPSETQTIHWSFSDPSQVQDAKERAYAFEQTARQLTTRINYFLTILARKELA